MKNAKGIECVDDIQCLYCFIDYFFHNSSIKDALVFLRVTLVMITILL